MAYLKHTWEDGELITTDKMNSIEIQLAKLSDDIDAQIESIAAIQSDIADITDKILKETKKVSD